VLWGILHRTIFLELLRVFTLALFALTGLVLMAGIVAEATRNGLGPAQILAVIPLLIPNMLPYTLPTTTLFACCVVYGRLAGDNEILAIKSAGVHIVHVLSPAMVLGVLASVVTLALYLDTIPVTHWIMRSQIIKDLDELVYGVLRKDGRFSHPQAKFMIFVERVEGKKLIRPHFVMKADPGQQNEVVAFAKEAELRFDLKNKQILVHMRHCHFAGGGAGNVNAFVDDKVFPVELPKELVKPMVKSRATDMTWSELWENHEESLQSLRQKELEIADHQQAINLKQGQPHFPEHVRELMSQKRNILIQIAAIDAEVHMRPAFALGCLCFVLIGCPVGIWLGKSDYLSAFITCFLPVVVVYYPLMLCMINLAKSGKVAAWHGIWYADGLMALVAALLFSRLARN
jgi:lipopolysaccharide export system permease protein